MLKLAVSLGCWVARQWK